MTDVLYSAIKATARRVVAADDIERIKRFRWSRSIKEAQDTLIFTRDRRDWITEEEMLNLQKIYPTTYIATTPHDAPDLERAELALNALSEHAGRRRLVEIGGGHGYVAAAVAGMGHDVTCVDIRDELKPLAHEEGVKFIEADARELPLPSNSVDGLWSFNCFEHIFDPRSALNEFCRVVKPGGKIYLNFAPIYNSALGLHAFYEIGVPFIQHLCPDETILPHVSSKDLWFLNRWSLAQYRELWSDFTDKLNLIGYHEGYDFQGLELIKKYPGCFIKRSRNIEDFIVSKIVVTFSVRS